MPFDRFPVDLSFTTVAIPVEAPADPFSMDTFIDWLGRQPDDKTYDYYDGQHCLVSTYFSEQFGRPMRCDCFNVWEANRELPSFCNYPFQMNDIANAPSHLGGRCSYGKAKAYARRLGYRL